MRLGRSKPWDPNDWRNPKAVLVSICDHVPGGIDLLDVDPNTLAELLAVSMRDSEGFDAFDCFGLTFQFVRTRDELRVTTGSGTYAITANEHAITVRRVPRG